MIVCALLHQVVHPAWEGFNAQHMLEEFAEAEAEKQRYLAAKAAAAAVGSDAPAVATPAPGPAVPNAVKATVTTRSAARSRAKA